MLLLVLTACSDRPRQPESSSATPARATQARYDLKGKIVAIDKSGKLLTVDHEEIPGLMGAMTMPYAVKDERALDGLTVGDQVTAKVVTGDGPYRLEDIKVGPRNPASPR